MVFKQMILNKLGFWMVLDKLKPSTVLYSASKANNVNIPTMHKVDGDDRLRFFIVRTVAVCVLLLTSSLVGNAQFYKQENLLVQKITGSQFDNYFVHYDGSPIFKDMLFNAAIKLSGGEICHGLKVKLDLYKDNVVYYNMELGRNIVVDKRIVDEVYLFNHKGDKEFTVRNVCEKDSDGKNNCGFYFILVDDRISLWLKQRTEFYKDNSSSSSKLGYFKMQTKYYFVINEQMTSFLPVKRSLIKTFPANKKAIQNFIKQNSLDLKNHGHLALLFQMINEWENQNPSF